jgi:hypothetical protein
LKRVKSSRMRVSIWGVYCWGRVVWGQGVIRGGEKKELRCQIRESAGQKDQVE